MGHFVRGEHDGGVLEEALREEVAERVVFFVEGEDGCIGDAWSSGGGVSNSGNVQGQVGVCLYVRVSAFSSTLFCPSSSRKSSNLHSSSWSALCETWRLSFELSRSPQFGFCSISCPILGEKDFLGWSLMVGNVAFSFVGAVFAVESGLRCMSHTVEGVYIRCSGRVVCVQAPVLRAHESLRHVLVFTRSSWKHLTHRGCIVIVELNGHRGL
jgi:hypothetical protein